MSKIGLNGTSIFRRDSEAAPILVVGGAGYIGSMLVRDLLTLGYQVRVLDNLMYGQQSLSSVLHHPNLDLIVGDCRSLKTVEEAVRNVSALVYLAGIVGDNACRDYPRAAMEINYDAPRMITKIAKSSHVRRFVMASTCSVYGITDVTVDEESMVNPVSLYAQSKLSSEVDLLAERTPTFAPVVLRFATTFGHSFRPRFDLAVNLLTAQAYHERAITIFNGTSWRPFIHVRDVANAVISVLNAPLEHISGEILNVGDSQLNYTFDNVAEILCDLFSNVNVSTNDNLDRRNYRVSFEKIRSILNFRSSIGLRGGIEEVKKYLEQASSVDYLDAKHNNHKFLQSSGMPPYNDISLPISKADGGEVNFVEFPGQAR